MSGYPQAHSGSTILFSPRTVMLPIAWILRAAIASAVIAAFLIFIAAMYGWRDGYSQGFRAGKQSHSTQEKTTP